MSIATKQADVTSQTVYPIHRHWPWFSQRFHGHHHACWVPEQQSVTQQEGNRADSASCSTQEDAEAEFTIPRDTSYHSADKPLWSMSNLGAKCIFEQFYPQNSLGVNWLLNEAQLKELVSWARAKLFRSLAEVVVRSTCSALFHFGIPLLSGHI